MRTFWMFLYNMLFIPVFWASLRLLGLVNSKVRRGIRGRNGLFERLEGEIAKLQPGPRIWFHSSSMGEFEQAKPIIAALKERYPSVRIIVTFFSPSGYEHSRTYQLADVITYIPFDSRRSARRFLDLVRPDLSVMVRYDIWPNHIWELHRRDIPVIIANATMSRHTMRRLPCIRSMHRTVYETIGTILAVAPSDVEAFRAFGLRGPHIEPIGDTRYDQVAVRSAGARKRSIVPQQVLEGKKVLVAGSSWPEDESILLPSFLEIRRSVPDLLLILVPHEPTLEHIEDVERDLAGQAESIRFSALNEYNGESVIIVDSIGILLVLYACAHLAYVGGSFRQGIHNVLEAAVYGIPVLFGPRHRNSHEPLMLVERGGAFVVSTTEELTRTAMNLLQDESARTTAGGRASAFVQANLGATQRILRFIEPHITRIQDGKPQ
ncbi:MAG: kdtA [Bacteroidetes bacterium]|jgi:3-deoxy-D-manno-octulosonic-acid transferase|nr:kdtA [Bacteroidota bacterium]